MIITTQTAYAFALLLLSSVTAGLILSVVYLLLVLLPNIVLRGKAVKLGYKAFLGQVESCKINKRLEPLFDFIITIVSMCTICSLLFLFNDGQFRLIAVAVAILGFLCGKRIFAQGCG